MLRVGTATATREDWTWIDVSRALTGAPTWRGCPCYDLLCGVTVDEVGAVVARWP